LLALIGGAILNLMPCVFPVLSIKALSLVKHSSLSASQKQAHGWIYTLGVLASFALLGIILVLLKAGGAQIGWGFQFQSPAFVMVTAYLMFLVGLNLSGVFTIGSSVTGVGGDLANKSGMPAASLPGCWRLSSPRRAQHRSWPQPWGMRLRNQPSNSWRYF
jgi:thiol:disulfide interchange protein DsbD